MKNFRKMAAVAILCIGGWAGRADAIKVLTPADGALVTQFHPVQEMLVRADLAHWKKWIARKAIADCWQNEIKSFPRGVRIDWEVTRTTGEPTHYELEYGRDPELKDAVKLRPPHSECRLGNLLLGETYHYRVSLCKKDGTAVAQTPVYRFTVEMLPPRVMMVPGIDNIRDLGGYEALEGRRIRQGMIYRSTGLNANSADGGKTPGKPRFTAEGKRVLLEELKIKTELDLRWLSETAGMKVSPLGESVRYVNNPSPLYAGAFTAEGKAVYARSFRIFTDPANYPVNFHCIAGSDRTGTLAYLLEAVLGVPEETLQKEYVFTSFFATRSFEYLSPIPAALKECGKPGESVLEQAERYWLSAGVTPAEIQRFRDLMLGEGTHPDAILAAARKRLELEAEIARKYPVPVKDAALTPLRNFRRSAVVAGKTLSCTLPNPGKGLAEWKLADDGGMVWIFGNNGVRPLLFALEGKFPGDPGRRYYLGELFSGVWHRAPSGKPEWSAEELSRLQFAVPPRTDLVFAAVPVAAMAAPEQLTAYPEITEKDAGIAVIPVTELPQGTWASGNAAEAVWEPVSWQPCSDFFGKKPDRAPAVQLATTPEHAELHVRVRIPDATPVAQLTEKQSPVWRNDSIEIFLAESDGSAVFHAIFGRGGGTYVEWSGRWNDRKNALPQGCRFAVREVPGGWMAEGVLPLTGFDFRSLPRFNVCGSDQPSGLLFNLVPACSSFHDVEMMGLWKWAEPVAPAAEK